MAFCSLSLGNRDAENRMAQGSRMASRGDNEGMPTALCAPQYGAIEIRIKVPSLLMEKSTDRVDK
jgi:hypothetical protein